MGLDAPDKLQANTVTQPAQTPNPEKPNQHVTTAENQATIVHNAVNSKERKTQPKTTQIVPATTRTTTVVKTL